MIVTASGEEPAAVPVPPFETAGGFGARLTEPNRSKTLRVVPDARVLSLAISNLILRLACLSWTMIPHSWGEDSSTFSRTFIQNRALAGIPLTLGSFQTTAREVLTVTTRTFRPYHNSRRTFAYLEACSCSRNKTLPIQDLTTALTRDRFNSIQFLGCESDVK